MMKSSLLILLTVSVVCVSFSSLVNAQNFDCNFQGNKGYYDLSPLKNTQVSGSDGNWMYYLQLCGVAPGSGTFKCNVSPYSLGAMACQTYNPYSTTNTFAIAYPNDQIAPHQWSEINTGTGGVILKAYAPATSPCTQRATTITITCDPSATVLPTTFSSTPQETSQCNYALALTHASACPTSGGGGGGGDSSDGGISGGTVFIIVLLVGAFVYVAGGCFYKRYKVGTTGMIESCPNNEFWTSIPGLVKDGCLYTVRKLRGLCGGSGSSSGSTGTYESI